MTTEYSEEIIRGIKNNDFLDEEGKPNTNLFLFLNDKKKRADGNKEESISWKDKEEAIDILLRQKNKDDTFQFKSGVAILCRHEFDRIIKRENRLSYERASTAENPYHGNMLLKSTTPKHVMSKIASTIAQMTFKEVIQNKYINSNSTLPIKSSTEPIM
jgi:hypothetical protein